MQDPTLEMWNMLQRMKPYRCSQGTSEFHGEAEAKIQKNDKTKQSMAMTRESTRKIM